MMSGHINEEWYINTMEQRERDHVVIYREAYKALQTARESSDSYDLHRFRTQTYIDQIYQKLEENPDDFKIDTFFNPVSDASHSDEKLTLYDVKDNQKITSSSEKSILDDYKDKFREEALNKYDTAVEKGDFKEIRYIYMHEYNNDVLEAIVYMVMQNETVVHEHVRFYVRNDNSQETKYLILPDNSIIQDVWNNGTLIANVLTKGNNKPRKLTIEVNNKRNPIGELDKINKSEVSDFAANMMLGIFYIIIKNNISKDKIKTFELLRVDKDPWKPLHILLRHDEGYSLVSCTFIPGILREEQGGQPRAENEDPMITFLEQAMIKAAIQRKERIQLNLGGNASS